MGYGLSTPPNEELHHSRSHSFCRKNHSSSKSAKPVHQVSKRTSARHHSHPSPPHDSSHVSSGGRHKRVWKACERCRMKKTKCDGEFPCKRCKDDGLVCMAGTRKKSECKKLPKGYAEVLEHVQFTLIATVHKLYAMVRSAQPWELGEPELNYRGQPAIHNIASKLGCIRRKSDIDLPVHSVFPEDEAGLVELAAQLEAQQQERERHEAQSLASAGAHADSGYYRISSSELDHSDIEHGHRNSVFGSGSSAVTLSPASHTYDDFDVGPNPLDGFGGVPSPTVATAYPTTWVATSSTGSKPTSMDLSHHYMQPGSNNAAFISMDLLNRGLFESNFGTIKPHVLSCLNPEVMIGMGDPMIYLGCNAQSLRM